MYYPLRLLQAGLIDVQKTMDEIIVNSFPNPPSEEIVKIEKHIDEIREAITELNKLKIKTRKPKSKRVIQKQDYPKILVRFKGGDSIKDIAEDYKVSYQTMQRAIKRYRLRIGDLD